MKLCFPSLRTYTQLLEHNDENRTKEYFIITATNQYSFLFIKYTMFSPTFHPIPFEITESSSTSWWRSVSRFETTCPVWLSSSNFITRFNSYSTYLSKANTDKALLILWCSTYKTKLQNHIKNSVSTYSFFCHAQLYRLLN